MHKHGGFGDPRSLPHSVLKSWELGLQTGNHSLGRKTGAVEKTYRHRYRQFSHRDSQVPSWQAACSPAHTQLSNAKTHRIIRPQRKTSTQNIEPETS